MHRALRWASANPAPMIFALRALHMHASIVFLDRDLAFRTSMCSDLVSPAAINLLLSLYASLPLVHWKHAALETKTSFALMTIYFLRFGISDFNYHILTFGVWTELLEFALNNLYVFKELLVLLKVFLCQ